MNFDFSNIKIEKGVPLTGKRCKNNEAGIYSLLTKLKKEESFTIPNTVSSNTLGYATSACHRFSKGTKKKFVCRTQGSNIRIWRVK